VAFHLLFTVGTIPLMRHTECNKQLWFAWDVTYAFGLARCCQTVQFLSKSVQDALTCTVWS